eukprot:gene18951-25846_t
MAPFEDLLVEQVLQRMAQPVASATRLRLTLALLDWFTAGWSAAPLPLAAQMRTVAAQSFSGPGPAALF